MEYVLIRDVTKKECNWLKRDYQEGEVVFLYTGPTYGCCDGPAFTIVKGETPFFELPYDSIKKNVT